MAKTIKKGPTSIVNEPAPVYKTPRHNLKPIKRSSSLIKSIAPNNINRWLGGNQLISNPLRSDFDVINAGAQGISKASVDALATHLGISRKYLAEEIFDLSVKTMERKLPTDVLDKRTSAHALEIAKVMQHAYDVFEDEEKVKKWMNKESNALNGMKPVSLFATLTGLNMVNDILGRIEEGVYS